VVLVALSCPETKEPLLPVLRFTSLCLGWRLWDVSSASSSVAINLPMLTKRPLPDEIQIPRPLPDPEFAQAIDIGFLFAVSATWAGSERLAHTCLSMNPTNRSLGTIYQNTNNYPIVVMLQANNAPPGNPAFGNSCALFGYIDERLVSVSVSAGLVRVVA
jgi:hypothetical protein